MNSQYKSKMMKNTITENEIKDLGFELAAEYDHDQFHTNRFQKGILEVEFTYEAKNLRTVDLTMQEVNCLPITKDELKQLDVILNKPVTCNSKPVTQ